jgi:hypothetical protein
MSALESLLASGGEAPLADALSYTVPQASSAVTMRKQGCRAFPTSASTLSPAGVRTVRIRLGGNDWFDPASLRLVYTIQNTSAAANLCPSCGPWGPFGLVRLLSGGVELDNIPMYHRNHELHGWRLLSMEDQLREGVFGWSSSWPLQTAAGNTMHPNQGFLSPGASLTVSFKPLLSIYTSGKALPCRYLPQELELTLAPATEWTNALDYAQNPQAASRAYTIGNIQLMCDSLVLDEAVQESFYKSLLSNRVLSIPTTLFTQVVQTIPVGATSFSFNLVRAFSRLSHIWLTFVGPDGDATQLATSFVMPTAQDGDLTASWNNRPRFDQEEDCPTIRLSIGPLNIPDPQPVGPNIADNWHMLQKALPGPVALDRRDFASQTFVSVFDLRRTPGDPTSALSTRSGDLVRVDIKNLTANLAASCVVTMWSFACLSIRESGCTLLD